LNADPDHQRQAGRARAAQPSFREHNQRIAPDGWRSFSAHWRAMQGLPLLDPTHIQFLTPEDFRGPLGQPLPPDEQRRRYRAYFQAALSQAAQMGAQMALLSSPPLGRRRPSPDQVHAWQLVQSSHSQLEVWHGRQDVQPWEAEALSPTHPYGVPPTSETFQAYWIADGSLLVGDEWEASLEIAGEASDGWDTDERFSPEMSLEGW